MGFWLGLGVVQAVHVVLWSSRKWIGRCRNNNKRMIQTWFVSFYTFQNLFWNRDRVQIESLPKRFRRRKKEIKNVERFSGETDWRAFCSKIFRYGFLATASLLAEVSVNQMNTFKYLSSLASWFFLHLVFRIQFEPGLSVWNSPSMEKSETPSDGSKLPSIQYLQTIVANVRILILSKEFQIHLSSLLPSSTSILTTCSP